jgi:hypothetical protein
MKSLMVQPFFGSLAAQVGKLFQRDLTAEIEDLEDCV